MLCSGLVAIYCSSTLSCLLSITQEGVWVGIFLNDTVFDFYNVPLTYLNCNRQAAAGGQSSLLGCLVRFDHAEEQCAEGREGQFSIEATIKNGCVNFCVNELCTLLHVDEHNTSPQLSSLTPYPYTSGPLCAMCDADRDYGITMDLTRCTQECSAGGAILFVLICE